jgi:hypothetical protein
MIPMPFNIFFGEFRIHMAILVNKIINNSKKYKPIKKYWPYKIPVYIK